MAEGVTFSAAYMCSCGCGYSKAYSELELLVQEDMKAYGLQYPHVTVDEVKAYWRSRLPRKLS